MRIPNSTNRRSPLCASLLPLRVCSACLLVCYLTQPLTKTTPMSEASPLVEMLHTADTFVPRQVEWVWEPWISRGGITLLDGDGGVGKSWPTMAIAAAVTHGYASS